MRRRYVAGLMLAVGMAFATTGFAHEVKDEHEGCDPTSLCPQQITCVMLEGELVSYPTVCTSSNCDVHSHDLTYCPEQPSASE